LYSLKAELLRNTTTGRQGYIPPSWGDEVVMVILLEGVQLGVKVPALRQTEW
jgi:hypothetical protein